MTSGEGPAAYGHVNASPGHPSVQFAAPWKCNRGKPQNMAGSPSFSKIQTPPQTMAAKMATVMAMIT